MDKVEAVEKTVKMWEWLAANPGRSKRGYFEEFGITVQSEVDECYLCDTFVQMRFRRDGCFGCPLYEAGEHCFRRGSAFFEWSKSISEARSAAAQKIVDVCKKWLEEQYNPAVKGTRHVRRDQVFEETGEFRLVKRGEWFMGDSNREERKNWGSVLQGDENWEDLGKRVIVEEVFPKPLYKAVMVDGGRFYSLNSWAMGCKEVEYVLGEIVIVGENTEGIFCHETLGKAVNNAECSDDRKKRRSKQWAVLEVVPLVKSRYKWIDCNPLSVKVVGVVERSVEESVWEELGGDDLQAYVSGGTSCMMIVLKYGDKTVAQIPFNGDKWFVLSDYKVERSEKKFLTMDGFDATFFKVLHKVK